MVAVKIVVCSIVGILGLLVLGLGFIAESKRAKVGDDFYFTQDNQTCWYVANPAEWLGILAAVLVLVAQIIANAYGGCVCCGRNLESRSRSKKMFAILCLVVSWILAVLSFILLLTFGILNSGVNQALPNDGSPCPAPGANGLAAGGVMGLIAAILGVVFCVLAPSKRQQELPQQGAAVEMPHYHGGAPNYDAYK